MFLPLPFVDFASSFAPSSPPHSFHPLPYNSSSISRLSPFLRCPRTSSPPHSPVTRAQPITTWAETMGSGDKPGASQSNPFDRAKTPLELPRPPFQPLKCIVTLKSGNNGRTMQAPFPMRKQRGNNFPLALTFRPPFLAVGNCLYNLLSKKLEKDKKNV